MKMIKQLTIILSIWLLGELMEYLIPLPISSAVYGLLLMWTGLVLKIIPLKKVENAADGLIEIMPVIFLPPAVSIISNMDMLMQLLVPLIIISSVSTVLIMLVTGRVAQWIVSLKERSHK